MRERAPAGNLPTDRFNPVPGSGAFFVYAPMDAGKGAGRTVADTVSAAFQRGDRFTYSSVTVTIQSVSQSAAFISGDRFVIPVSIAYRSFS